MTTANTMTGGEAVARLLSAHGTEFIFGLCGDTSLPFYDALFRLDHGMTHILTRDERHAAYMADAYARTTGRVGVCEGPSGGGATYILPGVVEASESSIPVLALTTDVSVPAAGRFPLTELRQDQLFQPLTKWNGVIDHPDRIGNMVRNAFRAMTTGTPGAAHLGLRSTYRRRRSMATRSGRNRTSGRFPLGRPLPTPPPSRRRRARSSPRDHRLSFAAAVS